MAASPLPLSVIDFATVRPGQSVGEGLQESVALAQKAEELGYERVWYSEHHNMPAIASSAPAVLMAHIASQTSTIRLGSGGVMLPNHSPIVIAEQFGTLAELHPGRIDLGLGRAPGTDPQTLRALRREPSAAEKFPDDVRERGAGRIVALTSDHSAFNLPYGTSKGALDRIITAAAVELAPLGISANVVNPGPIDTGWMDDETRTVLTAHHPLGRAGTPKDIAGITAFLLSDEGRWISGQLLHTDGGFSARF